MKLDRISNVKLGLFVTAGFLFLIIMLYMIGRDQNLFSSNITVLARFSNAGGLIVGNNVRYSGIQVGTVKRVSLLNDSTIEVTMLIGKKYTPNIHKNAVASISTEGLIGNRIVNIFPGRGAAAEIEEGDYISTRRSVDTNEMLETLSVSNQNVAQISENLKTTVERINNSVALWKILNDESLPADIKASVQNIRQATTRANDFVTQLQVIMADIREGKGTLGAIVTDTVIAQKLTDALTKIQDVGAEANNLAQDIHALTQGVEQDVTQGKGTVNALLKDPALVEKINNSLQNIQNGTAAFNDNMEALKRNFLFRGYFKKQERQKKSSPANR